MDQPFSDNDNDNEPDLPPPPPAPPQAVVIETFCVTCGYNLLGQPIRGTCSECGTPVADSLGMNNLATSDARWLGELKGGMTWWLVALLVGVIVTVAAMVVGMVTSMSAAASGGAGATPGTGQPTGSPLGPQPIEMLIFGAFSSLAIGGVMAVAVYKLTVPEPAARVHYKSRPLARWTLLPMLALGFITALVALANTTPTQIASQIVQLINMILFAIGFPAIMLYLRALAKRMPDESLAKQTLIVLWGMVSSYGLMLVGMIVMTIVMLSMFLNNSGSPQGGGFAAFMAVFGMFICVVMIALLTFGIWWIVLMFMYRNRFAECHRMATH